jgi:hypothetical protein
VALGDAAFSSVLAADAVERGTDGCGGAIAGLTGSDACGGVASVGPGDAGRAAWEGSACCEMGSLPSRVADSGAGAAEPASAAGGAPGAPELCVGVTSCALASASVCRSGGDTIGDRRSTASDFATGAGVGSTGRIGNAGGAVGFRSAAIVCAFLRPTILWASRPVSRTVHTDAQTAAMTMMRRARAVLVLMAGLTDSAMVNFVPE